MHICNLSFSTGKLSDEVKIATVIPMFQNENKNEFKRYRPISISSQFYKILEKSFEKRLNKDIE